MVYEASHITETFTSDLLSSVIALEGGHQIHEDLAVLRSFKRLGAVSMALTYECSTSWAQTENPYNTQFLDVEGITEFGLKIIEEMNQIGMMVDLSHSSLNARVLSLQASQSPTIFTAVGASSLCNSPPNVPDSLFKSISENGGLIMVPAWPPLICEWVAELWDSFRAGELSLGQLNTMYYSSNKTCTIDDMFKHIDYLVKNLGEDHVGIASNFDLNLNLTLKGASRVSDFVSITAAMVRAGYSETTVTKIIGGNYIRVWSINQHNAKEYNLE